MNRLADDDGDKVKHVCVNDNGNDNTIDTIINDDSTIIKLKTRQKNNDSDAIIANQNLNKLFFDNVTDWHADDARLTVEDLLLHALQLYQSSK